MGQGERVVVLLYMCVCERQRAIRQTHIFVSLYYSLSVCHISLPCHLCIVHNLGLTVTHMPRQEQQDTKPLTDCREAKGLGNLVICLNVNAS